MPLDPEVAAHLERQRHLPPRSSLDVAATREMMRRAAALSGPAPALPRIEDLVLPTGLPARQYWPTFDPTLPLTVYFHGGRFFSGDLESHDTICRLLALASASRILAVDYRLAPEHPFPAAVDDARIALEWALVQNVPVAVAGDSAGANLATVAALAHRHSARLRCQLLIYPMIDATCGSPSYTEFAEGYGPGAADMRRGWSCNLPAGTDPRDPLASPLYAPDLAGAAPALVMTAEYDTLRDEAESYARRLSAQLHRYPGAIHGFFPMQAPLTLARQSLRDAAAFLRHHF
ncbi:MAG TPA: alpha/beta hydrolase [Dongiaceae bacterium]